MQQGLSGHDDEEGNPALARNEAQTNQHGALTLPSTAHIMMIKPR
jgi:hypothetical protein